MSTAIVKYNAGNVFAVQCALQRLGVEAPVTDDPTVLQHADHVIFPGVGEASSAMSYLREHGLDVVIKNLTNPVLGICIGMQLMCRHSDEGNTDCIGIFDTTVKRFDNSACPDMKIPHMGWDTISVSDNDIIAPELNGKHLYYVHSFYAPVCAETIASTDYIVPFSGALHRDNFYATQFHPEISGPVGEEILKRFLTL